MIIEQPRRFNKSDIQGYYLPTNERFNRLLSDDDRERLELKLIMLTLAGEMLRRVSPVPSTVQLKHFYTFLDFLINDYGQLDTVRPAISHYFSSNESQGITELALVAKFDEFCCLVLSQFIELDDQPEYSACMLVRESPVKLMAEYRALVWHLVQDEPDAMRLTPSEYALDMLCHLKQLKEGVAHCV